MHSPPVPIHVRRETSQSVTSIDEARQALEVVMSFVEQRPNGFLSLHETLSMGRLIERLQQPSLRADESGIHERHSDQSHLQRAVIMEDDQAWVNK